MDNLIHLLVKFRSPFESWDRGENRTKDGFLTALAGSVVTEAENVRYIPDETGLTEAARI